MPDLDNAWIKVENAAIAVRRHAETPLHHAFATHLHKVSGALRTLEKVFEGDIGEGAETYELEAILSPRDVLTEATAEAHKALADLHGALRAAHRGGNNATS